MRAVWWGTLVLGVAGCVATTPTSPYGTVIEVQPTLPDGYPPKIGSVSAELNGEAVAWDTYDYSVGAFDSAVQILGFNDEVQFRLYGVPTGQPKARQNRLYVKAVMQRPTQTGVLTGALIEVVAGEHIDGVRLSSDGSPAEVVLDKLTEDDPYHGHVEGHFTATLCAAEGEPVRVDHTRCQAISGRFESELQFDNVERFR